MTYRIKGSRAAQQDTTQPTQMTRQYTAGSMAINAGVAQPGSPGSPFIGLKPKDERPKSKGYTLPYTGPKNPLYPY